MKRLLLTLVLGAAVAVTPAQADTVDVSAFTGLGVTLTSPYWNTGTTAGSVTISDVQGLAPLANGASFISFCVDLQHTITPPLNNTPAALDLMSEWDGYDVFTPQANAGRYAAWLYNTYASTAMTTTQRAGLGLAIWNVLYDNDFTVLSGTFMSSNEYGANTFLSGLNANLDKAALADAYWLRLYPVGGDPNAAPQDFIAPIPDGGMTLMLLGGALVGLGALRRKFRG